MRNARRVQEIGGITCPGGCGTEIANCAKSIGLHLRWSKDPRCIEYKERTKNQRKRATVRASQKKYMLKKKSEVLSDLPETQ